MVTQPESNLVSEHSVYTLERQQSSYSPWRRVEVLCNLTEKIISHLQDLTSSISYSLSTKYVSNQRFFERRAPSTSASLQWTSQLLPFGFYGTIDLRVKSGKHQAPVSFVASQLILQRRHVNAAGLSRITHVMVVAEKTRL
ncbi:hypothetical protein YC2023_009455 [Brassica napus]